MVDCAVIGGSGFYEFPDLMEVKEIGVETPYSDVIGIQVGRLGSKKVAFLARHGQGHRLPPHKIDYRANVWALKDIGAKNIISVSAVGGIHKSMGPSTLVLPDQIIDYTWGREQTYADLFKDQVQHIDFTQPYSQKIREVMIDVLASSGVELATTAVYGCMQGPRLETAAEIDKLEKDGCDVVGMTAMPEAALARELDMEYGSICSVVNWAAGRSDSPITMNQIHSILEKSSPIIRQALVATIHMLN